MLCRNDGWRVGRAVRRHPARPRGKGQKPTPMNALLGPLIWAIKRSRSSPLPWTCLAGRLWTQCLQTRGPVPCSQQNPTELRERGTDQLLVL